MQTTCKLTIAVLTMNRSQQLIEALDSCLTCRLPQDTEFIVLNNASTDDTQQRLAQFREKHPQQRFEIFHSSVNLGAGGGRSYLFARARGEYVYFLDDDAVIVPESREAFFMETLAFMDVHPQVASVTTQIEDSIMGMERMEMASKTHKIDAMPLMFFYLGGSQFLRKSCFSDPLCFPIEYGLEECAPSIRAMDRGYYHVCNESVRVLHRPPVNKWVEGSPYMRKILICGAAMAYATKKVLYPRITHPVLYLGYRLRCRKYLRKYPGAKQEADAMARKVIKENSCQRVRLRTVLWMYRTFGKTVL